jgi:hypothetical protein
MRGDEEGQLRPCPVDGCAGSAWHIRASRFACLAAVVLECRPPGIVTVNGLWLVPGVAQRDVDTEGVEVRERGVSSD